MPACASGWSSKKAQENPNKMNSFFEDLRELCQMPALKGLLAFASTWTLALVGHPESAAVWLLSLMVMDLALGLARAWREGSLKGKRLTGGAFKFFRYWLAVAVFVMADAALIKAFPALPVSLRDTFIAYLAINEAFSCIEKLAFFGMPIPEPFLRRLQNYRDDCLHGLPGRQGRQGRDDLPDLPDLQARPGHQDQHGHEDHQGHEGEESKPEGEKNKFNSKSNSQLKKNQ